MLARFHLPDTEMSSADQECFSLNVLADVSFVKKR